MAHNASFDFAFLNSELGRLGLPPLSPGRMVDTLLLAKARFPGLPNSLDALCRRFSIDLSERTTHNALLDCRLLADVYVELTGGRQRGLMLVDEGADVAPAVSYASAGPRRVRLVVPSAAALAAHAAFVTRLKEPVWADLTGTMDVYARERRRIVATTRAQAAALIVATAVLLVGGLLAAGHLSGSVDPMLAAAVTARKQSDAAQAVLSSVKDAETGQRGFLLTGRDVYLAPYTDAHGADRRTAVQSCRPGARHAMAASRAGRAGRRGADQARRTAADDRPLPLGGAGHGHRDRQYRCRAAIDGTPSVRSSVGSSSVPTASASKGST